MAEAEAPSDLSDSDCGRCFSHEAAITGKGVSKESLFLKSRVSIATGLCDLSGLRFVLQDCMMKNVSKAAIKAPPIRQPIAAPARSPEEYRFNGWGFGVAAAEAAESALLVADEELDDMM